MSVAFGSIGPSPPSTECVSPGTESPSPNPHNANDASVYPMSLDGRNASPTNPAASNSAPEAIASATGSCAASGRASSVAAGIALTIAAPWIGVKPNTSITSSTPRNSVPTSAPESIARATFPGTVRHSFGRHPSRRIAATCEPNVATSAAPATGAWKTKIARQSKSWVSTPPSAGPTAAPNVPASVQIATPACGRAGQGSEHRQGARQQQRAAETLDRARGDQEPDRVRERARDRRREEDERPGREEQVRSRAVYDEHEQERARSPAPGCRT